MKVKPTEAFCAIGPDGVIDIDLVRRNRASAQAAAGAIHSRAWPAMVAKGWQVIPVVIQASDFELPSPVEIGWPPAPAPAGAAAVAIPVAPRMREPETVVAGRRSALLRC